MIARALFLIFLCPLHNFAAVYEFSLSENKSFLFSPSEHITLTIRENAVKIQTEQKDIFRSCHKNDATLKIDGEYDFRFDQNGFIDDGKCNLEGALRKGDFTGVNIESTLRAEFHTINAIQFYTQMCTYLMVLGDLEGKFPKLTLRPQSGAPFFKISGRISFEKNAMVADLKFQNVHVIHFTQPQKSHIPSSHKIAKSGSKSCENLFS